MTQTRMELDPLFISRTPLKRAGELSGHWASDINWQSDLIASHIELILTDRYRRGHGHDAQ